MRINDLVHKTKTQRPQLQSEQQLTEQTHGEQATTMSQNWIALAQSQVSV